MDNVQVAGFFQAIVCIGKGLNSVGQSCCELPVTLAYVIDERVRCWFVLQQSYGLYGV